MSCGPEVGHMANSSIKGAPAIVRLKCTNFGLTTATLLYKHKDV